MTTTKPTYFAATTGCYSLMGGVGFDIHMFSDPESRNAWVDKKRGARFAISPEEATEIAPDCRHWDFHGETYKDEALYAWVSDKMRRFGGSYSFTDDEVIPLIQWI